VQVAQQPSVPEPTTLTLMLTGLCGVALGSRLRSSVLLMRGRSRLSCRTAVVVLADFVHARFEADALSVFLRPDYCACRIAPIGGDRLLSERQ
jgi:hypothetical protein